MSHAFVSSARLAIFFALIVYHLSRVGIRPFKALPSISGTYFLNFHHLLVHGVCFFYTHLSVFISRYSVGLGISVPNASTPSPPNFFCLGSDWRVADKANTVEPGQGQTFGGFCVWVPGTS